VSTNITGQDYNTFEELALLTDDLIDGLCKSIRSPGGLIAGPPAAAGGAAGPMGPNPGMDVTTRAQHNLKLLAYYLRFLQKTSMATVVGQITLANIRALQGQRDKEEAHEDPDPPTIEGEDWPKTLETIQEYLGACLGTTDIPLAYVIRRSIDPTPRPIDGWTSNEAHMIARAPIVTNPGAIAGAILLYTETYKSDNKQVWLKLASICRDKDCWTYIRRHQRAQDGRQAYWALYNHYLGANNVDNMSAKAERKLMDTTYSGEKRRWNFEKYVRLHVEQHAVLEDLVQFGYSGIDEGSKVRYLVRGVKTDKLDTVKTSILGRADLRNDFTASATLFKDFIEQMKSQQPDHDITIAAVGGNNKNDDDSNSSIEGNKKVIPDMSIEPRFYSKKEYGRLTPEQRAGLFAKRESREGGRRSNNKRKKKGGKDKPVTLSKATISAVVAAMKSGTSDTADADDDNDDDSESSEEVIPMKGPAKKQKIINNRTNPALQRRNK
jgi:hypothetical protein